MTKHPFAKSRKPGLRNTVEGVNPKDRIGATKLDYTVIPAIGLAELAFAMSDGDYKYGAYNYRVEPILARIYAAAAIRHWQKWLDGEERTADSLAHHLGHAAACAVIVIDAQRQGMLVDDRPIQREGYPTTTKVIEELEHLMKIRNEQYIKKMVESKNANS